MAKRRSSRGSVDWNRDGVGYLQSAEVAPLVGAWIEIMLTNLALILTMCRSSRGSVDWNYNKLAELRDGIGRSSRGSVDWNPESQLDEKEKYVAPLVGAWIEILIYGHS